MSLTLFTGRFGKGILCPDPHVSEAEQQRRRNRLDECVTHVRWHARRVSPGRVLVVTYQDCETAFAGIPNVETAHFNAIAGLDELKDVALLVIAGRPLPSTASLAPLVAGFLGIETGGDYVSIIRGVRMPDGSSRPVRVIGHPAEEAELPRSAICDGEVLQAVGRGRGVNRTADTPLEIHVLSDLALPLVHDRVLAWDMEKPDIVQRMLMDGIAVTSPADALALHPELFANTEQAKKALLRAGFRGQNPIKIHIGKCPLSLHATSDRAVGGLGSGRTGWREAQTTFMRGCNGCSACQ